MVASVTGRENRGAPGAFFGAGALLLIAGLAACLALLSRLGRPREAERPSLVGLALRNCGRRRWRSLVVAGLMACGTFLVVATGLRKALGGSLLHPRSLWLLYSCNRR